MIKRVMCKRHSFFVQFYRKKEKHFVQKDVRYNMCDLFEETTQYIVMMLGSNLKKQVLRHYFPKENQRNSLVKMVNLVYY